MIEEALNTMIPLLIYVGGAAAILVLAALGILLSVAILQGMFRGARKKGE